MEIVVNTSAEDLKEVEQSLIAGWKRIFNFDDEEIQYYLKEYKSRYKSLLN